MKKLFSITSLLLASTQLAYGVDVDGPHIDEENYMGEMPYVLTVSIEDVLDLT